MSAVLRNLVRSRGWLPWPPRPETVSPPDRKDPPPVAVPAQSGPSGQEGTRGGVGDLLPDLDVGDAADPDGVARQWKADRRTARAERRRLEPAQLLARRVLLRLATEHPKLRQRGAVVAFVVPDAWECDALTAFKILWQNGKEPSAPIDRHRATGAVWAVHRADQSDRFGAAEREGARIARAILRGATILGVGSDLSTIHADIVASADVTLSFEITPDDLADAARRLCRLPPSGTVPPEIAARVTPRVCSLAWRHKPDADMWLSRVTELVQRDAVPTTADAASAAKARDADALRGAPTLDRLHGMKEARDWGQSLVRQLESYRNGEIGWADVDRGCLLSGPPGCGKTTFARGLAATCGVSLVSGSYSQWLGSGQAHQGDLLKGMRKTFADAVKQAPSILFIDEIDSFPDRAEIHHKYREWDMQVVNALLAQIDGVENREGVVVLGACNHPGRLDPALVRSGRLDRHIRIDLPGEADLALILREHLAADLPAADLSAAATLALGSSGADCERFVRGARRRAREEKREMSLSDLTAEIGGEDTRSPADLRLTAVHEAGHGLAAILSGRKLRHLTIRPLNGTEGTTSLVSPVTKYMGPADIAVTLRILMSGRAAKEVVLGQASSGAGGSEMSDLSSATRLSVLFESAFGFGDTITWLGAPSPADIAAFLAGRPDLAALTEKQLQVALSEALALMRRNRPSLDALTSALLDRKTLNGEEAGAIVAASAADA